MEIIEDIRPLFLEATNQKSDDLIFMWNVKKINKRGKINKRTLVITTNSIYLVEKKPLTHGLKVSKRYGFESLISISKDDKDVINIKFNDHTIRFLEVLPNSVVGPTLEIILTIFPPIERPKLAILKTFPIEVKPKPNPSYWRLRYLAYLSNKSQLVTIDLRQIMDLMITLNELDFSIFHQFPDLLDEILDSLIVCPNIEKIIFRSCYPSWAVNSKFISMNKTVKSFETSQPINEGFMKFAQSYIANTESVLDSVGFNGNEFGPDFIEGIKIILQPSKIKSLTISNYLTKEGYQAIAPLILDYEGFQPVKYLDLSGCKYIEPEFLIIQLTNLTTLKINDCSIDVSVLLEDLSKNKHIPLTEIHFCDNFCSDKIDLSYVISKKLHTIVADSIAWQPKTLSKFLYALSNTDNSMEINLSVRDAQMSDPDWNELDEFLQSFLSNTIVSLDYSGNKIQSGFCTFLNNSPKLTKLTVNGCFSLSRSSIEIFSRYLSSNQNLKELYVLGTETHYLGSSVHFLFKAFKNMPFLHVLDISHNMIGNQVLNLIFELVVSNPNMRDIYFDYNGISEPQMLQQFVHKISEMQISVNIHLPLADISAMVQQKRLQEHEVEKMKQMLNDSGNNISSSKINTRERNNSIEKSPAAFVNKQAALRMSGGGPSPSFRASPLNDKKQLSLPRTPQLSQYEFKRLNSLSSIDAFSQSISNSSCEKIPSFAVRSTSANSLNSIGKKVSISTSNNQSNVSDSSSKDQVIIVKKKRARRSSDIIFAENKSNIPFEEQLKFEQVRDEYISDNQWVSFLNDIPSVNFEPYQQNLEKQLSYYSLMQAIQPK